MRNLYVRRLIAAITPIIYVFYAACGGGKEDEALKAAKAAGDKRIAELTALFEKEKAAGQSSTQLFQASLKQAQDLLAQCTDKIQQVQTLAGTNGGDDKVAFAFALLSGNDNSPAIPAPNGLDASVGKLATQAIEDAKKRCNDLKQQALLLIKSAPLPECDQFQSSNGGKCQQVAINDKFWSQYIASVIGPALLSSASSLGLSSDQLAGLQSKLGGLTSIATMLSSSGLPAASIQSIMSLLAGQLATPATTTSPVVIGGGGGSTVTSNFNLSGGRSDRKAAVVTDSDLTATRKADVSPAPSGDALTIVAHSPNPERFGIISADELRRAARAGLTSAKQSPAPER